MKITRTARTILSVTALAWTIPFAQANDKWAPRAGNDSVLTAKVRAALLREPALKSLDVSVQTFKGEVMLSGFVKDQSQRAKAVKAATTVAGVTDVKDSLAVRN